jgi:ABC-type Fe3+-hydroxamate transport system substrate-binding protein
MQRFIDQMGREVLLKDSPKRIVSLVPSQTELLFDIGLEDEVVGITKFCVHPKSWFKAKKRVGGTKNVSISSVKELNPDLIIANKEENTIEDILLLEQIAPVWISDINSFEDAIEMIQQIGNIVDKDVEAKLLIADIRDSFQEPVLFETGNTAIYFIWKQPFMCAGKDTFIDAMMTKIGLKNLITSKRYPVLDIPFNITVQPKWVLLSSEPYPFNETHLEEMKKHFPDSTILIVDGEFFSWYGSRMSKAASYFNALFNS